MDIPQITSKDAANIGEMGQTYLTTGKHVALRRWEEPAGDFGEPRSREYEIVGYVLSGAFELDLDGGTVQIYSGDSWLIPAGATHRYRIIESLVAIEATSPPARFNDRDEPA
ncbi:cupin domain-containing protein [Stieleria varia]|uniref:Cupin domain protein n=1 Tax=Stieleria varia TaxID=2528005 RepID=A0A5C6AT53_9BACT|nr:cupin domain-containing protein [Stieleria varia]TWU02607.1 Cupin domain protein [Stieleria varia]